MRLISENTDLRVVLTLLWGFAFLAVNSGCVTRDRYNDLAYQTDSLVYELYKEQMLNYKLQQYAESLYYEKIEPRVLASVRTPIPALVKLKMDSIIASLNQKPLIQTNENPSDQKSLSSLDPEKKPSVSPSLDLSHLNIVTEERDGKTILTIREKFLFRSGSVELSMEGTTLLEKIGKELAENPRFSVMVVGHTDNIEVGKMQGINDNWDLSVRRATAVVRALIASGVHPGAITAAGKSKFDPLASNKDEISRSLNRRIEIILSFRDQ